MDVGTYALIVIKPEDPWLIRLSLGDAYPSATGKEPLVVPCKSII